MTAGGAPGGHGNGEEKDMKAIRISPSLLSADFSRMGEETEKITAAGADMIHCDVMDGSFVPPITFGAQMVSRIRAHTRLPLDVHLMVEAPWRQTEFFARAGADILTVHAEACGDRLERTLEEIRKAGMKAGVAVRPDTPVGEILSLADRYDMLLVMSVYPGYGGQKMIPETLDKAREARRFFEACGLETDIEMDGGIRPENAGLVRGSGVNVLVAGSAVFRAADPASVIRGMRGE